MNEPEGLSWFQRLMFEAEILIMTRLVPGDGPGPFMRWVFKIPVIFHRLGLWFLVGKRFLILETTGRKTGKTRFTALEYEYLPQQGAYRVMSGWGGKTDWYQNARANPRLRIHIGKESTQAIAEPVPREQVAEALMKVVRLNPRSLSMFNRWTERPIDGSEESFFEAAVNFPSLNLRPTEE
ncbi:MAG: nitroreductase family deazaflavin-dependent oxidoreductase [Chloroflexi bacterium]|nr:nitroreductase family deazaflavin-dependent oxidoreductase [Chloroflexota bacterium]